MFHPHVRLQEELEGCRLRLRRSAVLTATVQPKVVLLAGRSALSLRRGPYWAHRCRSYDGPTFPHSFPPAHHAFLRRRARRFRRRSPA